MRKPQFTEQDGHQLAADLLRELGAHWRRREDGVPDEQLSSLWHRDRPVILRRYLATVRARRSPELECGFLAVLSDYIGCAQDGSIVDPDFYEGERRPA